MLLKALLLLSAACFVHASVTGYINEADKNKLLSIVTKTFINITEGDVISPYYGAKGFNTFEQPIVKVLILNTCAHLEAFFKPDSGPEPAFHALTTWALLCKDNKKKLHTDVTVKTLRAALENEKSTVAELRYAAEALTIAGETLTSPSKVAQLIQARLKEDDSLQNLGHALHAASVIGKDGQFALQRVEDVVVQADEVDGRLLQWEGGLLTTSLLLTGLLRLPGAKPLTQTQADKFAAYLLTRKTVQSPKGALALAEATMALSKSTVSPVCVSFVNSAQVTTDAPNLKIRISDLFGKVLKPAPTPVVAQSATRVADDVVVLSKQPLSVGSEPTEYVLALNLEPGQYRLGLTAGSHSSALTIRVLGPVSLQWLEAGVGDSDGSSAPRLTRLQYPSKLPSSLQADSSQHLIVRFTLSRSVHQAFLRLSSGKREIIFVAEQDSSKVYKVDVDLAAELMYSATFQMEVLLGDSIMSNPIRWGFGDIDVKLSGPEPPKLATRSTKPEIKHMFRPAEKRPPQVVSMLFTALAAAPLLLLLIIWMKLGINVSNFSFSAIPFHIGLGSIFGLFTLFWLKFDMFTTCAWLIPLGSFTFLAGHRILSKIAKQRKP